jgi:hypothetical protein
MPTARVSLSNLGQVRLLPSPSNAELSLLRGLQSEVSDCIRLDTSEQRQGKSKEVTTDIASVDLAPTHMCLLRSLTRLSTYHGDRRQTEDDVIAVLILPAIVDDTSVLTFAKSHSIVSDWAGFLLRAAKCLLLDPFKVRFSKMFHRRTSTILRTCDPR